MADRFERTPEEREAARRERERRRALAAGGSPPSEPTAITNPLPQQEPPPSQDGQLASEDGDHSTDEHEFTDEHDYTDEHEVASGTRRVGWRERTVSASAPRPARREPVGPKRPAAPLTGRRRVVVRVLAVVALVIAAAVIWFCVELFQPFHGSGRGSVMVTIPPRSSTSSIGNLLERDGVISSGFFFELRAALAGDRGKLLAGTYHLKLDMSYSQVLKTLTTPPPAAKVTAVTIVPGETRLQINGVLRSQGVPGSYLAETRRSALLRPAAYGAPPGTTSLEGFLFPDTYQLREPISVSSLVSDQLTQFRKEFATVNLAYARSKNLTPYDVLIIASIIEKEAGTKRDFPLVASVVYNRLHDHIPLGMDSTTRYEYNDYTKPLTQSQLSSPSPYNTRLRDGLPPTPISNPSLSAIRAAANPARTGYLYFVVKPGSCGQSVFESSYAKFLRDSARYQSARAQRGGRSPTNC